MIDTVAFSSELQQTSDLLHQVYQFLSTVLVLLDAGSYIDLLVCSVW
jgi:hypothetical protein